MYEIDKYQKEWSFWQVTFVTQKGNFYVICTLFYLWNVSIPLIETQQNAKKFECDAIYNLTSTNSNM